MKGRRNYSYHEPLHTHHPWCPTYWLDLEGETRLTEVFEISEAPATFRSDMWKHFGFPVSRNEKGEKVTDKQKQYAHSQTVETHLIGNMRIRSHLANHQPGKIHKDVRSRKICPVEKTLKEDYEICWSQSMSLYF